MKIETKFTINDLVQHKFQKPATMRGISELSSAIRFMEVLYIDTNTCSGGTQTFYKCRPFYPVVEGYKEDRKVIDLGFGVGKDVDTLLVYREDELKAMSQEEKDFYGV